MLVTLVAVGDISLQTHGDKNPFGSIKESFRDKDILFGNLETVLAIHGKPREKAVIMSTLPQRAAYLKEAGFDVVNIANNHILDLGFEGFQETIRTLKQYGIMFIGAGANGIDRHYTIVEKKSLKIGFLGYTEGEQIISERGIFVNKISLPRILEDIKMLKKICDIIVVSLHWGIEKTFFPSPKQMVLARRLVDEGVKVVLGHHPHVIQGIEMYKDGLIAYSLGNFQFRFNPEECLRVPSKRTNESFVLKFYLTESCVQSYEVVPVEISKDWIPRIPAEEKQKEIRNFIKAVSASLEKVSITEGWWFEQIAEEYLKENLRSFWLRIKRYGTRHLLQCLRWLVSPFCLKCYLGLVRRKFNDFLRKT